MAFADLVEVLTDENGGTGTTLSVTFTSAPSENDLVVLVCSVNGAITTPSGFSIVCAQTDGTTEWLVFYKVAGASESSTYTVTHDSTSLHTMIGHVFDGGTNGFHATPVDTSKVDTKESGSSSIETDTSGSGLASTNASNLMLAGGYLSVGSSFSSCALYSGSENSFTDVSDANALPGDASFALVTARRTVTSTATFNPRFQITPSGGYDYNYGWVVGFKEGAAAAGGIIPQAMHHYNQIRNN